MFSTARESVAATLLRGIIGAVDAGTSHRARVHADAAGNTCGVLPPYLHFPDCTVWQYLMKEEIIMKIKDFITEKKWHLISGILFLAIFTLVTGILINSIIIKLDGIQKQNEAFASGVLFCKIAELLSDGESAELISVVESAGSTPRGAGAMMFIREDGKSEGTIGGGSVEYRSQLIALEALREPCKVELYSDSQYLVNAINEGWLANWQRRGWRRKEGEVKNIDLWQRLVPLLETHEVTFNWVKGHAENEYNNRCDELAVAERLKFALKA
jgi:ribonuclease HI